MSFSIIIPSRNINNLMACVKALREANEFRSDGLTGPLEMQAIGEPWSFARAVNIGIRTAMDGGDSVVLLNDDVLLETPKGLTGLFNCGLDAGIISPQIRGPAHLAHQWNADPLPRLARVSFMPFVCVAITRRCISAVGVLDEQFTPGSYEDNDYCRRAIEAGYGIVVDRTCVVDHEKLPHTFRPDGKPDLYDLAANRKRYEDKWRGK